VASGTIESGLTDKTGKASFNVLKPGLTVIRGRTTRGAAAAEFGKDQFFADLPGALTVQRESTYTAQKAKGLLLVHQNNVSGAHLQVVPVVSAPTAVHVAVAYNTRLHRVGTTVTVSARVVSPVRNRGVPRGPVTFFIDGRRAATVAVGPTGLATYSSRALTPGSHVVGLRYAGWSGQWTTSKATTTVMIT
jgi:hypothetical protein